MNTYWYKINIHKTHTPSQQNKIQIKSMLKLLGCVHKIFYTMDEEANY